MAVTAFCFVVVLSIAGSVRGQTVGDAQRGFQLALKVCEECHVVATGRNQPKPTVAGAPSFFIMAKDPDVTPFHLKAFFRTPHHRMPDFILKPGEQDDLIAYIMSLKPKAK